jgi:hypothetical protein
MPKIIPSTNRGGGSFKPILRSDIIEAQRHTNSNTSAAKWLGVNYATYRRYAKIYGLFDSHANPKGIGVDKGWSKNPRSVPLREILEGKYPKYSLAKLKNRLLARNKLENKCYLCGFDEHRITDGKVPLMLTFKNDDRSNFNLDNLELRCYNCMLLTTGATSVINRNKIVESLVNPGSVPKIHSIPVTAADYYDPMDTEITEIANLEKADIFLSDEEKAILMKEIQEELE